MFWVGQVGEVRLTYQGKDYLFLQDAAIANVDMTEDEETEGRKAGSPPSSRTEEATAVPGDSEANNEDEVNHERRRVGNGFYLVQSRGENLSGSSSKDFLNCEVFLCF